MDAEGCWTVEMVEPITNRNIKRLVYCRCTVESKPNILSIGPLSESSCFSTMKGVRSKR